MGIVVRIKAAIAFRLQIVGTENLLGMLDAP
jgi:hypothetical protein